MREIKKKHRCGHPPRGHIAEATRIISIRFKESYCEILDELLHYYAHFMREKISRSEFFEIILNNEYQKTLHNNFNILGLELMICKRCEQNGKKSKIMVITDKITSPTAVTYYDENGQFHIHDSNIFDGTYRCSNGHEWTSENKKYKCWCGWEEKDE
jgi:hypothetical protein